MRKKTGFPQIKKKKKTRHLLILDISAYYVKIKSRLMASSSFWKAIYATGSGYLIEERCTSLNIVTSGSIVVISYAGVRRLILGALDQHGRDQLSFRFFTCTLHLTSPWPCAILFIIPLCTWHTKLAIIVSEAISFYCLWALEQIGSERTWIHT